MSGSPRSVVVPAAGLGTRLSPLTLAVAKELLPLGAYPALTATLLEAAAAGVPELTVVTAPNKPQIGRFFSELRELGRVDLSNCSANRSANQGASRGDVSPALGLARLLAGLNVRLVEQPAPLGVLDAVARGLALAAGPCAVVFPDLIHLPDQTALRCLFAAHEACGEAVIGLRVQSPGLLGGNGLAVELPAEYGSAAAQAMATGAPLPICSIRPQRGEPGELVTTFGQIHTPALNAAIEQYCRPRPEAPLADAAFGQALQHLAARGKFYGVLLPGEVVDLGSLPGYLDAAGRFLSRRAQLRGLP